jgi:hypothetical protein
MIYYCDGVTPVELGDLVELNGGVFFLFKKLRGAVIYVPGVSPLNLNMEFNGLQWVAVDVPGKAIIKQLVDPDTGRLVKKIKLLHRNISVVTETQRSLLDLESDN